MTREQQLRMWLRLRTARAKRLAALGLLALAAVVTGCAGAPDLHQARVACTAGVDNCLALGAAIDAWNAKGGGHIALVLVQGTDPADYDALVQMGNVSKPATMCAETWDQTVSINPTPSDACTTYDPAVVLAHELGHVMSGRKHSPVPGALMGDHGNHRALEDAITPADVDFVFGGGEEVP